MDDAIISQLTEMMGDDGYIDSTPPDDDNEGEETSGQEAESREVEGEEAEVESPEEEETEESEEEAEGEPEEAPEDQLFDITIGDEEYEVNLEELKTGYLRNEDLIAHRTKLDSEHQERVAELEQTQEELRQELERITVFALGGANQYDQINWAQLKQQDPEQYQKLRVEAFEAKERADALLKRRNDVTKMAQEAGRLRHEAYVKQQREIAKTLIPEIGTDPEFGNKIVAFGKQLGYTETEITEIADARQLAVLNQARLYAESQVRKKAALETKVQRELPPAVKPGAPTARNTEQRNKTKQARQRLSSERSIDAAASYILSAGLV